ncbi:MAG TPA: hypothetical protein VKA91_02255 [Nitrososphaeraceae archaeon]|nr:hypothetical protein [Nitrososphaeraceae archaeon]
MTYRSIAGNPFDTGGGVLSSLPPDHAEMIAENEVKDSLHYTRIASIPIVIVKQ